MIQLQRTLIHSRLLPYRLSTPLSKSSFQHHRIKLKRSDPTHLNVIPIHSAFASTWSRNKNDTITLFKRSHSTNSNEENHHHHHHHNLEDIKGGEAITKKGIYVNVALTISKAFGGIYWNSASLLAEAVHNLGDLLSDFIALFTYRLAYFREPNETHPYGFSKYESLGSLSVSALLVFGSVGIGIHSLDALLHAIEISSSASTEIVATAVTSHAHENVSLWNSFFASHHHNQELHPAALAIALVSVGAKEWLYRATIAVGKKINSNVLIANAIHHRSDALGSVVALGGIAGSLMGFPYLDAMGGIVISGMIAKAGYDIGLSSLKELTDQSPSRKTISRVLESATKVKSMDNNILDFHSLRIRKMGPYHLADMTVYVNPQISVSNAHQIGENIRFAIMHDIPYISEVLIHLDAEPAHTHPHQHHRRVVSAESEKGAVHHHHHHHAAESGHNHSHDVAAKPTTPTTTRTTQFRSTSQLESQIQQSISDLIPSPIRELTHLTCHYLTSGIEVHADISITDHNLSIKEAKEIAKLVRERIEAVEGVVKADVHLELEDSEGA